MKHAAYCKLPYGQAQVQRNVRSIQSTNNLQGTKALSLITPEKLNLSSNNVHDHGRRPFPSQDLRWLEPKVLTLIATCEDTKAVGPTMPQENY